MEDKAKQPDLAAELGALKQRSDELIAEVGKINARIDELARQTKTIHDPRDKRSALAGETRY